MLRRLNEKKEGEDDEAYHMRNLKEIKKEKKADNSMFALIVLQKAAENEFGGVEIWSTDSGDDKVRRPTHDREFVAKEKSSHFGGRCLVVTNESSQTQGSTTEGESGAVSQRDQSVNKLMISNS